ncbi:MAG: DUF3352 domain-containing protein [Methylacidiphilales bacterium]|nr:DUF3352 domain-containing protein [Candidatus Methylacidiphilales bacterium]
MTQLRLLFFIGGVVILLFLGLGVGAWWYLSGPNAVDSAELVPANSIAFASIPNGVAVLEGYRSSRMKTLIEAPNAKPLIDALVNYLGQKNADLITAFLPNLSGQSFIAVTHFDYDDPGHIGLIAAMRPKPGLGDFSAFLDKLKANWAGVTTGSGSVDGVDYEWIQGPGAPEKICVAHVSGWIVSTLGEATLQDWLERFRKVATTSSLADNAGYRSSLARVGDNPTTLVYVDCHALVKIFQEHMAKRDQVLGDFLAQKLDALSGAAVATRFENGEIVDRFSFLLPSTAQSEYSVGVTPCPFETLKFAGPDTLFYWATNVNWKQFYDNIRQEPVRSTYDQPTYSPVANDLYTFLHTWAHNAGLDTQHDIVDPLGSEISVQAEWSQDSTYPEAGLFVKLDKPDDFKPTITAIIDSVRKAYATSAVVNELNSNGQNFATLQFVQASFFNPTITENGPYLGIFLTGNQAVRSFQREETIGLAHNADFNREVGDKLKGAAQVYFLDSPRLLDRGYRTAMPYLSIAEMFNRNLAASLRGVNLPPDLTWLAPMDTWSCVVTPDEEGLQGYSVSGIGNQGILVAGALTKVPDLMETMGWLPKNYFQIAAPVSPPLVSAPPTPPPPADAATPAPSPGVIPDSSGTANATNTASTNLAPAQDSNSVVSPSPPNATTHSAPATNSSPHATPPNPDPVKAQ